MRELEKAPNIGKIAAEKLEQVGISNIEELREVGSREAFLRLKFTDPTT